MGVSMMMHLFPITPKSQRLALADLEPFFHTQLVYLQFL